MVKKYSNILASSKAILLLVIIAGVIVACGKKGPLYIQKSAIPVQQTPVSKPDKSVNKETRKKADVNKAVENTK